MTIPIVRDPLNPFEPDFFTSALHRHAYTETVTNALPFDEKFTIKTSLPLTGSEPLVGMKSMTCSDFTVFSLLFKTDPILSEVSKYSNGTLAVTSRISIDDKSKCVVYAKSFGFEETSSARIKFDTAVSKQDDNIHLSIDIPSLENPDPVITLGSCLRVSKFISFISQATLATSGRKFLETVSLGAKFQPCGHMHAGIGAAFGINNNKRLVFKNIQSSIYLGTHHGGTIGIMTSSSGLGHLASHNISLGATTRMESWLFEKPNAKALKSEPPVLNIPSPVLGINYDMLQDRLSTYADFKFQANNNKPDSSVQLKLRIGLQINPATKLYKSEPLFSMHLKATEM